jgi:hypothetical protein
MPISAYIYAAILAIGIAIGAGGMYRFEHYRVVQLELGIQKANNEAQATLQTAKDAVAAADAERDKQNQELDKANAQSIQTIIAYRDINANDRMRDRNSKSCSNTLPTNPTTNIDTTNGTNGCELSTELAQLLRSETFRADKTAVEKNELLKFVKDQNCGIKK